VASVVAPVVTVLALGAVGSSQPTSVVAAPVGTVPTQSAPIAPPSSAPPTRVIHGIMDGNDYEVGVDVPAGKYHTDGADGVMCYATITDSAGNIVKWINVDGPSNIDLKNGQKFSTHGGVVWEYLGGQK
jgi:hypothetical protein